MINVIGIGNSLRGDDAIGPLVIEEIEKEPFENVHFLNAGSDAFTVLDYLMGDQPVIIIDSARMGKNAGEVVTFNVNDVNIKQLSNSISLHGYGFADIYRIAEELGTVAPCTIIGVEPKYTDFNHDVSDEVKASVPKIINMIHLEAIKDAKKNTNY